jgi:hypothetical protein
MIKYKYKSQKKKRELSEYYIVETGTVVTHSGMPPTHRRFALLFPGRANAMI